MKLIKQSICAILFLSTLAYGGVTTKRQIGIVKAAGGTDLSVPSSGSAFISDSAPQTLTNKIINASSNTVTNVSLTTGVTGVTPLVNGGTNNTTGTATVNANLTGPVTSTGNATAVTNNAITNAMAAQMAAHTYKGNNTGSTANAADLSQAQLTAEINAFTSSLSGAVPSSGGGTTNYLRADGTFAAPPGTGSGGSQAFSVNTQSGSSYTFALTDGTNNGNTPLVEFTGSTVVTATVPPNSSVAFPVGSQITTLQDGTGQVVFTPGAGVTINSLGAALSSSGQYTEQRLIKLGTNIWELLDSITNGFITATGGSITTDGNYKVHTFTTSGTFQITAGYEAVDSLVVAGGGGGGRNDGGTGTGGGAGAGGFIYSSPGASIGVGSFAVTVGSGGTGGSTSTNGGNSTFVGASTITAIGGGHGGDGTVPGGATGGSGGGGANGTNGSAGTGGQGNAGGNPSGSSAGGGGGGANAVGANATSNTGGNGGAGTANSITGASVTYAGGGGGGGGSTGGTGGTGGGGHGQPSGTNATANTGGGGGGSLFGTGSGTNGGSGIVIIRYRFQ